MQYCAQPGCAQLVPRGRCRTHAVQQEHTRDNYAIRRWYRTVRWRRLRARVLRECAYQCATCGQVQLQLEVDHITPHGGNRTLFWSRDNVQGLCPSCHTRKTVEETRPKSGQFPPGLKRFDSGNRGVGQKLSKF
jgi:5-methylcytosine-specific restriction enzyme A